MQGELSQQDYAEYRPRFLKAQRMQKSTPFWVFALRIIGTVLFLGTLYSVIAMTDNRMIDLGGFVSVVILHIALLAVVVVCFGAATGLAAIQRMEAQLNVAMRRQSLKRTAATMNRRDSPLAPNAPSGWVEHKPIPRGEVEKKAARRRRLLEILDEDDEL